MFSKTKTTTIKLNLRNDTGSAMEVKVGDKVMTLDPGKPVSLKVDVGTRIVANSATPNHEVGSLIMTALRSSFTKSIAEDKRQQHSPSPFPGRSPAHEATIGRTFLSHSHTLLMRLISSYL
jgi:hypothetical protein